MWFYFLEKDFLTFLTLCFFKSIKHKVHLWYFFGVMTKRAIEKREHITKIVNNPSNTYYLSTYKELTKVKNLTM